MRKPKASYVCPRCGHVLPRRDAVVSGWDSEGSSTHVHCPRCGKIIARYVEQERRNRLELDRIDKVLFILPFIPLVDVASTLFLLKFGGKESSILAEPVYERYGQFGLVALSMFAFVALLGCVWFLKYAKTRINQGERSKPNRAAMVAAVIFFFLGEAYLTGVVIQNLLAPLLLSSLTLLAIRYGVACACFAAAIFFTRTEMKRLIRE